MPAVHGPESRPGRIASPCAAGPASPVVSERLLQHLPVERHATRDADTRATSCFKRRFSSSMVCRQSEQQYWAVQAELRRRRKRFEPSVYRMNISCVRRCSSRRYATPSAAAAMARRRRISRISSTVFSASGIACARGRGRSRYATADSGAAPRGGPAGGVPKPDTRKPIVVVAHACFA